MRIRHFSYALVSLIVCLLWFELTPSDLWVQHFLYDTAGGHWIWSEKEPISHFVFYDGIKGLLIIFALWLLFALIFSRRWPTIRAHRSGLLIVLLSLAIVPLSVGWLKSETNVTCPKSLVEFGGDIPYVGVFESYPPDSRPAHRQRCFPAGHASGGFALMSLFFLFHSPRRRKAALLVGIGVGWAMGTYKVLIGDHFLSHNVVSMILAWIIISGISVIVGRFFIGDQYSERRAVESEKLCSASLE